MRKCLKLRSPRRHTICYWQTCRRWVCDLKFRSVHSFICPFENACFSNRRPYGLIQLRHGFSNLHRTGRHYHSCYSINATIHVQSPRVSKLASRRGLRLVSGLASDIPAFSSSNWNCLFPWIFIKAVNLQHPSRQGISFVLRGVWIRNVPTGSFISIEGSQVHRLLKTPKNSSVKDVLKPLTACCVSSA